METPAFQDLAWTAKTFGQPLSSLLEIGDWSVARELDVAAAVYIHEQEMKRELEREERDREFWIAMFGGKQASENDFLLEDEMARSALSG